MTTPRSDNDGFEMTTMKPLTGSTELVEDVDNSVRFPPDSPSPFLEKDFLDDENWIALGPDAQALADEISKVDIPDESQSVSSSGSYDSHPDTPTSSVSGNSILPRPTRKVRPPPPSTASEDSTPSISQEIDSLMEESSDDSMNEADYTAAVREDNGVSFLKMCLWNLYCNLGLAVMSFFMTVFGIVLMVFFPPSGLLVLLYYAVLFAWFKLRNLPSHLKKWAEKSATNVVESAKESVKQAVTEVVTSVKTTATDLGTAVVSNTVVKTVTSNLPAVFALGLVATLLCTSMAFLKSVVFRISGGRLSVKETKPVVLQSLLTEAASTVTLASAMWTSLRFFSSNERFKRKVSELMAAFSAGILAVSIITQLLGGDVPTWMSLRDVVSGEQMNASSALASWKSCLFVETTKHTYPINYELVGRQIHAVSNKSGEKKTIDTSVLRILVSKNIGKCWFSKGDFFWKDLAGKNHSIPISKEYRLISETGEPVGIMLGAQCNNMLVGQDDAPAEITLYNKYVAPILGTPVGRVMVASLSLLGICLTLGYTLVWVPRHKRSGYTGPLRTVRRSDGIVYKANTNSLRPLKPSYKHKTGNLKFSKAFVPEKQVDELKESVSLETARQIFSEQEPDDVYEMWNDGVLGYFMRTAMGASGIPNAPKVINKKRLESKAYHGPSGDEADQINTDEENEHVRHEKEMQRLELEHETAERAALRAEQEEERRERDRDAWTSKYQHYDDDDDFYIEEDDDRHNYRNDFADDDLEEWEKSAGLERGGKFLESILNVPVLRKLDVSSIQDGTLVKVNGILYYMSDLLRQLCSGKEEWSEVVTMKKGDAHVVSRIKAQKTAPVPSVNKPEESVASPQTTNLASPKKGGKKGGSKKKGPTVKNPNTNGVLESHQPNSFTTDIEKLRSSVWKIEGDAKVEGMDLLEGNNGYMIGKLVYTTRHGFKNSKVLTLTRSIDGDKKYIFDVAKGTSYSEGDIWVLSIPNVNALKQPTLPTTDDKVAKFAPAVIAYYRFGSLVTVNGKFEKLTSTRVYHTCSTTNGDCGSPVFVNGKFYGIHQSGATKGEANSALLVTPELIKKVHDKLMTKN